MSERKPRFPIGKTFKIKQEFTFEVLDYNQEYNTYKVRVDAPLPDGVLDGTDAGLIPIEQVLEWVDEDFLLSLTPQGREVMKEAKAKAIRNEIAALQKELEALEGDKKKKK